RGDRRVSDRKEQRVRCGHITGCHPRACHEDPFRRGTGPLRKNRVRLLPWIAGTSPAMTVECVARAARPGMQNTHQHLHPPIVTLGLDPRVQSRVTERLPWMLGSSPSMTKGCVASAVRTWENSDG